MNTLEEINVPLNGKIHDQEGKRSYNCEICNNKYFQKHELKRHVLRVHEEKKPFECKICENRFTVNQELDTHFAMVHSREKGQKCGVCDFVCFSKGLAILGMEFSDKPVPWCNYVMVLIV